MVRVEKRKICEVGKMTSDTLYIRRLLPTHFEITEQSNKVICTSIFGFKHERKGRWVLFKQKLKERLGARYGGLNQREAEHHKKFEVIINS